MKRGEKNKPLWKKITRGTLYPFPNQRNRRVKPQEQIRASEEELAHVIDQFELVEDGKGEFKVKGVKKEETVEIPDGEEYGVVSAGRGWFNVVSQGGKVMNDKKLRAEEAKELKDSLEEETE